MSLHLFLTTPACTPPRLHLTPCTASLGRWSVCIVILALRQSPSFSNGGKIFVLRVTPGVVVNLFAGLSAV